MLSIVHFICILMAMQFLKDPEEHTLISHFIFLQEMNKYMHKVFIKMPPF